MKYFEQTKVNLNGVITSAENAKISIFDRGFLYGDSVYEVTRSYHGNIFALDEHLDRLFESMKILSIQTPWTKSKIKEETIRLFNETKEANAYIRIMVTRGISPIGLDPALSNQSSLIIICKKLVLPSEETYQNGYHYIIAKTKRVSKKALDPMAKSGNYLNSILALIEAKNAGADDAIMLNELDEVIEGTTNNIWIVKNNIIYTPPVEIGILKGITRDFVISIIQQLNMPFKEQSFSKDILLNADEVFMTSSTKEIVPITKINHQQINQGKVGPTTLKLMGEYKKMTTQVLESSKAKA